jgi:hypothetical protein
MSDSSDVEVFILTEVGEEIEKKRKQKKKRMWMHDIFVSRVNFIHYFRDCAKTP